MDRAEFPLALARGALHNRSPHRRHHSGLPAPDPGHPARPRKREARVEMQAMNL